MKSFKTRILGLALTGLILGACSQTATYETADLMNEQAAAEKAGFKMTPFGTGNTNALITYEYEGDYFSYSEQEVCVGVPITVRFNIGQRLIDCGTVRIDIWKPSDLDWVPKLVEGSPVDGYYEFTYTPTEIGDFKFRGTYSRVKIDGTWCGDNINGFTGLDDDYLEVVVCPTCDDESFSYSPPVVDEVEGEVDVTFSYNYSEEAEVTLAFTFPQIISDIPTNGSYTGVDGKTYTVTGNGTVFHWTGIVSCSSDSPTTFAFEGLVPDCGAGNANDGQANIWTDAKVTAIDGVALVDDPETLDVNEGPYSLKGDLASIVYEGCPVNP